MNRTWRVVDNHSDPRYVVLDILEDEEVVRRIGIPKEPLDWPEQERYGRQDQD